MGRSKRSQSKHDATVRNTANRLKKQGYDVKADVSGFKQPDTIRGYRPDIDAKKGGKRLIVEVETADSVGSTRDQKQQKAFSRSARDSKNTTFERKVIVGGTGSTGPKKRGNR